MSSPEAELPELKNADIRSYKDPGMVKVGPGRRRTDKWGVEWSGSMDGEGPLTGEGEAFIPVPSSRVAAVEGENNLDLMPLDTREWNFCSVHGTAETRKALSWIWTHRGLKINLEDGADNNNELLRAEWCWSRARARRAQEEVKLVREEMRRTLEYLSWAANTWEKPKDSEAAEKGIAERRNTYAGEQAGIQRALRDKFEAIWAEDGAKEAEEEVGEEGENLEEESKEEELIDEDDGYE
ncbi:hypothetical protein V5O48_017074 [Marasmius crinis-equi]|uniref:Uncharacterized protein n=1 Tax=Marasmius crinis-equi TaxID=585013 RepID=A0ABR3EQ03_9AGAR